MIQQRIMNILELVKEHLQKLAANSILTTERQCIPTTIKNEAKISALIFYSTFIEHGAESSRHCNKATKEIKACSS